MFIKCCLDFFYSHDLKVASMISWEKKTTWRRKKTSSLDSLIHYWIRSVIYSPVSSKEAA